LAVEFKGLRLDCGYRLDLLVAKTVVVASALARSDPLSIARNDPYWERCFGQIGET
jgi:hypothetical protein